jgi:hypothetical protein
VTESAAYAPVVARLRPLVSAARRLENARPLYAIGAFVVVEWLITLGLALKVRHNGWLFYQGGDQSFFYTTSSLLWHGKLVPPLYISYGWPMLQLPLSLVDGPNLLNALPAIVLINVVVLMPVAMFSLWGIAERIAGRLFAYWALFLWIVIPLIGIKYVDTGFKSIYSDQGLPDSFGLTALSDFPQMVSLVAAAYFTLRALQKPTLRDGVFAGALVGAAIGIKPSVSMFLVPVVLAVVASRQWRVVPPFAAGIAPCLLALLVWKWRGLGYLPVFHAQPSVRLALGSVAEPLGSIHLHKYFPFDWHEFANNLSSLREHFWSERVFEWIPIAGAIGLARRSWTVFALVAGWFFTFVIVKGAGPFGSLENGSLLHKLVPTIPAFVLVVAALPFLFPGVPRRMPAVTVPRPWASSRVTWTLVAAVLMVFAVVPIAFAAVSQRTISYAQGDSGPVPIDSGMHVRAERRGVHVVLTWSKPASAGARPYFLVLRGRANQGCGRPVPIATDFCYFAIGAVREGRYIDTPPHGIGQEYWIVLGANWLDSPIQGEYYVAGGPAVITVPR